MTYVATPDIALILSIESKHGEDKPDHNLSNDQNRRPNIFLFRNTALMNDRISQFYQI